MTDTKTTPIELAREILEARDQIEATSHKAEDFVPNCVVVAVHSLELLEQAEQLAQAVIDRECLCHKRIVGLCDACAIKQRVDAGEPLGDVLNDFGIQAAKVCSQRESYQRGHAEGVSEQKEEITKIAKAGILGRQPRGALEKIIGLFEAIREG